MELTTRKKKAENKAEKTDPNKDEKENDDQPVNNDTDETQKPKRNRKKPAWMKDKIVWLLSNEEEEHYTISESYKEAMQSSQRDQWLIAMKAESESQKINNTWKLVKRPKQKKLIELEVETMDFNSQNIRKWGTSIQSNIGSQRR